MKTSVLSSWDKMKSVAKELSPLLLLGLKRMVIYHGVNILQNSREVFIGNKQDFKEVKGLYFIERTYLTSKILKPLHIVDNFNVISRNVIECLEVGE